MRKTEHVADGFLNWKYIATVSRLNGRVAVTGITSGEKEGKSFYVDWKPQGSE